MAKSPAAKAAPWCARALCPPTPRAEIATCRVVTAHHVAVVRVRSQLSLSEITSVTSLDPLDALADGRMFCFSVVQAPLSFVLRCRDEHERRRWVGCLLERCETWRAKRQAEMTESGYTVATAAPAQADTIPGYPGGGAPPKLAAMTDVATSEPTTSPTPSSSSRNLFPVRGSMDISDDDDDSASESDAVIALS